MGLAVKKIGLEKENVILIRKMSVRARADPIYIYLYTCG